MTDALAKLRTALKGFDEASKNGYETTWVRDLVEASRAVLAGLEAAPHQSEKENDDDQARVAPSVPGVVGQDLPQRGPTGEVTAATRPEPHLDDAGDLVCEHGTAMDVHCCNCHSGFQFNAQDCHCHEGALPTDKIWQLLNEADDHKTEWKSGAWRQWFVGIVDAVSQLESDANRRAEYNSGREDCAICHRATQNGVWGCDGCWDEIKVLCGEYMRLRRRDAFDQAHGLRPLEEPASTNAVDPVDEAFTVHPRATEDSELSSAALLARVRELERDSEILRRCNIVEIAVHNDTGSVSDYMDHWEGRALQAEGDCGELRATVRELEEARDADLRALPPTFAAALCVKLKEECEAQHARAETAEARVRELEDALGSVDQMLGRREGKLEITVVRVAEIRRDIEDGRPYPWQTWRDRCAELLAGYLDVLHAMDDHAKYRAEIYEPQLAECAATVHELKRKVAEANVWGYDKGTYSELLARAETAEATVRELEQARDLTFADLITANLSRVQRWHPENGLADWSPLEWAGAMAGEAGEACNAAKKLKRIDIGTANINTEPGRSLTDRQLACKQVAKEVADTVIYGALLVAAVGEDLGATVIEVFNRKSEEYGFSERLGAARDAAGPKELELHRPAGGASEAATISASPSTGALTTDAIWTLLNEADEEKSQWYAAQWGHWFVRLVDAVCQIDSALARADDTILEARDAAGGARPPQITEEKEHDEEKTLARVDTTGSPQSSRTASKNEVLVMDESKPETAAEALARWDAGDVVWTVEMGGLGPGYEQVIHIMAFEIIRELLSHEPLDWTKADAGNALPDYDARQRSEWGRFTNQIEAAVMPKVRGLGSSGAQWGAAQNLAYIVVRKGWRKALDELPAERLIQIDRTWPRLEEPEAVGAVDPHDGVVTE